jgi:hypothetical protein
MWGGVQYASGFTKTRTGCVTLSMQKPWHGERHTSCRTQNEIGIRLRIRLLLCWPTSNWYYPKRCKWKYDISILSKDSDHTGQTYRPMYVAVPAPVCGTSCVRCYTPSGCYRPFSWPRVLIYLLRDLLQRGEREFDSCLTSKPCPPNRIRGSDRPFVKGQSYRGPFPHV